MTAPARGHLFVVQGDLTRLVCDAFAVSSSSDLRRPSKTWRAQGIDDVAPVPARRVDEARWVHRLATHAGPRGYVVPIAGTPRSDIAYFTDAIAAYLDVALADHVAARAADDTRLPRLAVPFLGSGFGGARARKGDLIAAMTETLADFAATHPADVVLVLVDGATYDAAQAARRRLAGVWDDLAPAHVACADQLAMQAMRGELALFIGAGVSQGAGLPGWHALLDEVARKAGVALPSSSELSALERAELLERRLAARAHADGDGDTARPSLAALVVESITTHQRYTLAHALLAKLPVREYVTTNYDKLLESAVAAAHPRRADARAHLHVIPYDGQPDRARPWLMKLHGCVDHADDIVLSRTSFLRYETRRAALAGVLAGLFVTRHVLFVGSSFSDDNVIRILDEVLRLWEAGSGQAPRRARLGTNLAVGEASPRQELWQDVVDWVPLGPWPAAVRTLDIFLDRLAAQTSTGAAYLFQPTFDALLVDADRDVQHALQTFFAAADATDNPALLDAVDELRARFGAPPAPRAPRGRHRT